jgi:riboflavin kinase/FMN adenylyltransferase
MADLHMPRYGVYAVSIDILTGPKAGRYGGAASIGVRPTFGVNAPNLEVYIFDFDADIYGQEISVSLIAFLRDEAKFEDVDVMVAQMAEDCDKARVILSAE